MISPQFENKSTKYIFAWPEFICEVGRMHIDHDRTSCQLIFINTKDSAHILRTRLNIETNASRAKLAKDLTERCPIKDLDWLDTIEYIAEKTMRELEHGEPVITIQSTDEFSDLKYLIYPIIPEGKPTAIFGDPGSGKSQLAVILSMVMSLPWSDNPLKLGAPEKPVKVLFLDYEADIEDIQRQLALFTQGMELGYGSIEYRRCSMPIADDLEGIRKHIEELDAKCLIIDSVSLAAGGDLNRMDVATNYVRSLRSLGPDITSISLAHTSKDRESKIKTILGSVLFEAGFRSVWEIRADEGNDTLDIALFHRKANLSKKFHDIGFRISYTDAGNIVESLDPRSVPEFVRRMSVNKQILEALKHGKLSSQELVEQTDNKISDINVALSRLKKANQIIGDSKGWGLLLV